MKGLPIGIQDFLELRRGGFIYIDKTRYIHKLVTEGKYYFLSRPRRFGKSLLISTIKELFQGNHDLFKDLWIEDRWNWGKANPVLHIPFSSLDYKENDLGAELQKHIQQMAAAHAVSLRDDSLKNQFRELLEKLSKKKGRVVLLIDEYDKPIIDYISHEIGRAKENQQTLKNFYSVIKDSDPYLRLVFITGVSKFSRVSIFSDLNNLYDITMSEDYVSMLGYTQEELEYYFSTYLDFFCRTKNYTREDALRQIQKWYDGYSWDGEIFVYNPFSILLFFRDRRFANYWFKTATPTFLIDIIRKEKYYDFDGIQVGETAFDSFDIERLNIEGLLFQTGYLTIKKYDRETRLYTLGYPNQEVKESMLEYLVDAFSQVPHPQVRSYSVEVVRALKVEDFEKVKNIFNALLYALPHHLHQDSESFYHAIIHLFFNYMGLDVHSEVNTARGRADALLELDDKVYCFEFKLNRSATEALRQIKERGYLNRYRNSNKKLIAIGINFSTDLREIDDFKVEVQTP